MDDNRPAAEPGCDRVLVPDSQEHELRGLSSSEVERRLSDVGANVLPAPGTPPVWRKLLAQFVHFFARMLWAAGGLAIVGGLPALGAAIFIVIVVTRSGGQ